MNRVMGAGIKFLSLFFIGTFCTLLLVHASGQEELLLAQSDSNNSEMNVYDPFADYAEFENTAEEQKSIDFFQSGRFLTIGILGGTKIFTLNMARLYGVGPLYGGYVNYFFNLNFSMQFIVTGSNHAMRLSSGGQTLLGSGNFLSLGVDFKYFFSSLRKVKSLSWLQPYVLVGVSYASVTQLATLTGQDGQFQDEGFGINVGAGLQFLVSRTVFFAVRYSFHYITFIHEAVSISFDTSSSSSPGTFRTGFKPYGDWMNIFAVLGVNF